MRWWLGLVRRVPSFQNCTRVDLTLNNRSLPNSYPKQVLLFISKTKMITFFRLCLHAQTLFYWTCTRNYISMATTARAPVQFSVFGFKAYYQQCLARFKVWEKCLYAYKLKPGILLSRFSTKAKHCRTPKHFGTPRHPFFLAVNQSSFALPFLFLIDR